MVLSYVGFKVATNLADPNTQVRFSHTTFYVISMVLSYVGGFFPHAVLRYLSFTPFLSQVLWMLFADLGDNAETAAGQFCCFGSTHIQQRMHQSPRTARTGTVRFHQRPISGEINGREKNGGINGMRRRSTTGLGSYPPVSVLNSENCLRFALEVFSLRMRGLCLICIEAVVLKDGTSELVRRNMS